MVLNTRGGRWPPEATCSYVGLNFSQKMSDAGCSEPTAISSTVTHYGSGIENIIHDLYFQHGLDYLVQRELLVYFQKVLQLVPFTLVSGMEKSTDIFLSTLKIREVDVEFSLKTDCDNLFHLPWRLSIFLMFCFTFLRVHC